MKQIINGKMYNTETARKVGTYWNGISCRDFNYVEETLYKKKTGEFFLYGEGGANTGYSKSIGLNCWSGGEEIIPFTERQAREFAEKKLEIEEYIACFGEPEE